MRTKAIEMPKNWKALKPHPLAELAEFGAGIDIDALAEHMRQHGYDEDESIIMLDGMIFDGRHRHPAAIKAGVVPTFREFIGKNPLAYIAKKLHRQHLSTSQRAMMAAEVLRRADAEGVQIWTPKTLAEAAKTMNVSRSSVANASKIQADGTPELVKAVKEGVVTVDDAFKVSAYPEVIQDKAVQAVRKGHAQTALDAAELPSEARLCLTSYGMPMSVAKHFNRLWVYNHIATTSCLDKGPAGTSPFASWADREAKLILFRPGYFFNKGKEAPDEIIDRIDYSLSKIKCLAKRYGGLPREEAARRAEELVREDDKQLEADPLFDGGDAWYEYDLARLWKYLEPDFSRLTEDDFDLIDEAIERFCSKTTTNSMPLPGNDDAASRAVAG